MNITDENRPWVYRRTPLLHRLIEDIGRAFAWSLADKPYRLQFEPSAYARTMQSLGLLRSYLPLVTRPLRRQVGKAIAGSLARGRRVTPKQAEAA